MPADALTQLTREALLLVIAVAAPPVLAALFTGLAVGLLQAVTQVQDQALSMVVRIVAVFAALAVAGPWACSQVARFAVRVLTTAAL